MGERGSRSHTAGQEPCSWAAFLVSQCIFVLWTETTSQHCSSLYLTPGHWDSDIGPWGVDAEVQTRNACRHTLLPVLVCSPWELCPPHEGCHLWLPVLFWSFPWWRSDSPAGDHTLEDKQRNAHVLNLFRKCKADFEDYCKKLWKFSFHMGYTVKLA